MSYRDLIPGRLGGHVVASHIRIPGGGPVLDYVHYHELHYQLIYCRRGEVRVVYEDQGEPFWMRPGDLVLQPPRIRHRVLECSPGLEVIEIGCPAVHRTIRDPELELPTGVCRPEREFDGQRFAHFRGGTDNWQPADARGYETRCLLSVDVSRQRLSVMQLRVADGRPPAHGDPESGALGGSFRWWFVLDGSVEWQCAGRPPERLSAGDALTVPGETPHRLAEPSADCELLEVAVADRVGGQRTRGGAMPG